MIYTKKDKEFYNNLYSLGYKQAAAEYKKYMESLEQHFQKELDIHIDTIAKYRAAFKETAKQIRNLDKNCPLQNILLSVADAKEILTFLGKSVIKAKIQKQIREAEELSQELLELHEEFLKKKG